MIRLFIGINLDKYTKEPFLRIKEQVSFKKPSWAAPKNVHITVKFLGWSREESAGKIKNSIRRVTSVYKPFKISINGLGAFPTPKKARIFWVGLKGDVKYLCRLESDLEDSLFELGFKKEKRPYHPHITLARLRETEDISNILSLKIPSREMDVNEITLFQSKLTSKGAVYSVIENFPFNA